MILGKDTLRILVDWKCNLKCPYCCNDQQRFREQIVPIPWSRLNLLLFSTSYKTVCVSGGEPLLFMDRTLAVIRRALSRQTVVLYTNGMYLNAQAAATMASAGLDAINVGLHYPKMFDHIIRLVRSSTAGLPLNVRFQVCDDYRDMRLEESYPGVEFRYWKMDDCDRGNEDRIIISDWESERKDEHAALRVL